MRSNHFSLDLTKSVQTKSLTTPSPNEISLNQGINPNIEVASKSSVETGLSFGNIRALIINENARQAASAIDQNYTYLSHSELELLKQEFLNSAVRANVGNKKNILVAASSVFDELDIWQALANVSVIAADWPLAFSAQLRASELENDPIDLEALLIRLANSSSYLATAHEKNNDQLSIRSLYQRLVDLHPHFGVFQLKLANAHARLYDYEAAKNIYTTLSYDPELGEIAQQALSKIIDSETDQSSTANRPSQEEDSRANDIIVPLIKSGSSFLVDAFIERERSRLLLDTGASITALSTELVQRLNLAPTGQSIQLSTANGLTRARLYRVEKLSLGLLTLRNMIVAEIDLGRPGSFDGLLGTDALNQFNSRYSYLIDNQKSALIFRVR